MRSNSNNVGWSKDKMNFFTTQNNYTQDSSSDSDKEPDSQRKSSNKKPSMKSKSPEPKSTKRQKVEPTQLFQNMNFLFVPNNTKSKVTKIRMKAFSNYGATISNAYDPHKVTHLLVDPRWKGLAVRKELGDKEIPNSVKIVYNNWPSDCIDANKLLDTDDYKVPGILSRSNSVSSQGSNKDDSPEDKKSQNPDSKNPENTPDEKEDGSEHSNDSGLSGKKSGQDMLMYLLRGARYKNEWSSEDDQLPVNAGAEGPSDANVKKASSFAVNHPSGSDPDNPNKEVLDQFNEQLQYYESIKEQWRAKAYRTAINSLKKCPKPIRTAEEARKLPGFGQQLADHLQEIIDTGKFSKKDYQIHNDEQGKVISVLLKIYGVGPTTAGRWYREGVRTLDDVRKRQDLTDAQKIGLDHYDDFDKRIPREEVKEQYEIVKQELHKIDPEMHIYCMGSYRRGMPDCGDVDTIITKQNAGLKDLGPALHELLSRLKAKNIVKCTLAGSPDDTRWLGAMALSDKSPWRRVDILLVPWNIVGASLIYYTGDDIFNRSLRLLAKRKGYRLSNNGLWLETTDANGNKTYDTLIEASSEKKIFNLLDVPYWDPRDRNVGRI